MWTVPGLQRQILSRRQRGVSTSMPIIAPGCLLAAPSLVLAPTSRSSGLITGLVGGGESDHVEDAMQKDYSDDEPDHISGDSEEETPVAPPAPQGPFSSGEFQIGQSFQTKEEAVMSVKDYGIRRGVQYRVMESDHLKYVGRCKEFGNGCTWMIRVALRQRKGNWEVRRPSYRKVWKAKQKAVAQIYGDWEESYAELPRWILGMQATMDGTVALLKTSPVRVGDEIDESTDIDGTHLYGKYGGTLLLAIAQDGNSNILPVVFALVEWENAESWAFFLSHLRQHVTPQEGILVISDRHNGIKAALEAPDSGWKPPHAYQTYCIRHVTANFSLSFKGQVARWMLVNAVYAKTEAEFDY
ncbi:uncharacterized protein LOC130945333 [Arachis stenosperma]|uniref:uncharacterized protein LOC130945333 n=1 Tax=Arachis stenosperma TaxID=217475 RepID=UPI0025AC21AB|nr:uncharacterized protein LOC130945333 [Arachis stenosperma]